MMGSCDAQCARRDDEEPMIRREQAVEQQLQEGDGTQPHTDRDTDRETDRDTDRDTDTDMS